MLQLDPTSRSASHVWLAAGAAWGLNAAILLAGPVPALDLASVLTYSVAWLLFAPAVVLASRIVPLRGARILGVAVALAAAVTGIANLVGAGMRVELASALYAPGILLATALLVPLSYLFAKGRANRLSLLTILLFLALAFTPGGIGGFLVLAAFGVLSWRPGAFQPSPSVAGPPLAVVPDRA